MCHVVLSWTLQWIFLCIIFCCTEFIEVLNHFELQKLAVALTPLRYLVLKYKFILDSSSQLVPTHFSKACLNACSFEAPGTGCLGSDSFRFEPWEPHFNRNQCILLCTQLNMYLVSDESEWEEEGSERPNSKFNLTNTEYVCGLWLKVFFWKSAE